MTQDGDHQQMMFRVEGIYEYFSERFDLELERRKRKNQFFSALELKTLLRGLLDVSAHLENEQRIHGDVRPVYLTLLKDCTPILCDRLSDPRSPLRIQYTHFKKGHDLYMGPQLFHQFCLKENEITVDFNKSEAFSIGLLLLESGLLVSIQDCFDWDKKKFDEWLLQLYLN